MRNKTAAKKIMQGQKMAKNKLKFEPAASALARWNPAIRSADTTTPKDQSINIYEQIGADGWGGGVTLQSVSDQLDAAGGKDVVVNINSAGGDFFEGLAMYSLLQEYSGNVSVRVLGLAASAASIVAMAGDDIQIAENGFLMVHNAWTFAMGNKNDLNAVADMLDQFDSSMCDIYSDKTGIDPKKMCKMMDSESWIGGADAVEQGFCSGLLGGDDIDEDDTEQNSVLNTLRKVDVALAKSGMPRSERRAMLKEITSTPSATVEPATPSAGQLTVALEGLLKTIKKE